MGADTTTPLISRFIWHELLTADIKGGRSFYTEVIGWTIGDGAEPSHYKMFCRGELEVAGSMKLPPRAVEAGAPPHWLGHVKVADVDAAAARVTELGGSILVPAQTIDGVGSFSVIADPQGASLSLFEPTLPFVELDGPGTISWNELNTTDDEAAWSFYAALFDWEAVDDVVGGGDHVYRIFKAAGADKPMGGISNTASMMNVPPHWLYYIAVDDIDATIARVTARGGEVLAGPMEVPGGDRIAQCRDPQGAAFALHTGGGASTT